MTRSASRPQPSCVIASSRPWNQGLADALRNRSRYRFERVSRPSELTLEKLRPIAPRYVFFPHWSHRIDPSIYENFECVIFHMTDLPFGRGGSPLQNLIARGIYETKISALRCVAKLDAGPIYLKRPLSLQGSAEEIYGRASDVIADMILAILRHHPRPQPQRGKATVFRRRRPEDGDLVRAKSLLQAFDAIRMLDAEGYPPAFVRAGPFRIEFTRASLRTGRVLADARITLAKPEVKDDQDR
jgi:methionyl-tRNA formyltransferase